MRIVIKFFTISLKRESFLSNEVKPKPAVIKVSSVLSSTISKLDPVSFILAFDVVPSGIQ